MEPDCDVEELKVDEAKTSSKGQSMEHDCDVEKLKIQSSCKGNCLYKRVVNKRSRSNFSTKSSFKNQRVLIKHRKNLGPGVPPGRQKIEFAAKMAQDASKSGFEKVLEASCGRLGRPKREPSWSKIEAGRVFFRS